MKSILKFINGHKIITSAILLAIIAITFFTFNRGADSPYEFVIAQRQNITQEVNVTGRVQAAESVDLAFEKSGRVSSIYINIGSTVFEGQKLISQNNSDLLAQLNEAQANIKAQQAQLDELQAGTRPEDVLIKKTELQKAEQDLNNIHNSILNELEDSYTKADDAVNTKTTLIFSGSASGFYELTFTACNNQAETNATDLRATSDHRLDDWRAELDNCNTGTSEKELEETIKNAKEHLIVFKEFLRHTNTTLTTGCARNNSALDTYRTNVSSARANIDTAISNTISLEQSIISQKTTVAKAEQELNLKLAGARPEQIAAQEAKVAQAEAGAQNIHAQINKTILISPINGIVTRQETKVGEIVAANTSIVSIISKGKFEIETFIPEVDIPKIKISDLANLTFDAYSADEIFTARVTAINPAETIIEGVATYKITLHILENDPRIRPGMTANIDILTAAKENIIAIPQRAIIYQNGNRIVRLLNNNDVVSEIMVQTGLRGSDGNIEITSGIKEGDKVIVFEKQ
ncbi:MAG: efflux RND transporter periplasmic adaptor subunit [Patescibacteria group bacterium]